MVESAENKYPDLEEKNRILEAMKDPHIRFRREWNDLSMEQTILAVKLHELDRQYEKLQARIRFCQSDSYERLEEETASLQRECEEDEFLLIKRAENSRTPAAKALADAQLSYRQRIEEIKNTEMEGLLSSGEIPEKHAEAKILYAEYCIDFAVQAVKDAMLASMLAVKEDKYYEKWRKEHE